MTRTIRLHPAARRELDEAADFYDSEVPGLGARFLDEVERAAQQILAFPESSPVVLGPARKKVMAPFPYSIVYAVSGDGILILAFAHHHRRPLHWRGRE